MRRHLGRNASKADKTFTFQIISTRDMLSQSFSRASLRNLSRRPPRVFPQASRHSFPCIHPSTFIPCRYESEFRRYPPPPPQRQPPRRHHLRYDVEEARRAKPLFTNEQISGAVRSPKLKWIAVIAVGSGTIFYFSNLETVPVSGRKRFNCYSDATLEAEGARAYRMILQEHARSILPEWDRRTKLVKKVMARLIPASGLEHVDWEVHVISSNGAWSLAVPVNCAHEKQKPMLSSYPAARSSCTVVSSRSPRTKMDSQQCSVTK